jgi:hypothetical protein
MAEPRELAAAVADRMVRWIAEPGLTNAQARHLRGPQVAARTMALAYVAGTTGNLPARTLAKRLHITPQQFSSYTAEARRVFGLANPNFSGHAWRWGRRQA